MKMARENLTRLQRHRAIQLYSSMIEFYCGSNICRYRKSCNV